MSQNTLGLTSLSNPLRARQPSSRFWGGIAPTSRLAKSSDTTKTSTAMVTTRLLPPCVSSNGSKAWQLGMSVRLVTSLCADDKVHVGSRLIFYGGFDRSNDVHYRKMPWPVIPMSDSNLSFFRHGIDQDYSAIGKIG